MPWELQQLSSHSLRYSKPVFLCALELYSKLPQRFYDVLLLLSLSIVQLRLSTPNKVYDDDDDDDDYKIVTVQL